MPRNRKTNKRNRRCGKSNGPGLNRAGMRMGGTGGITAPLAVDYPRPKVRQTTKTPTRKGSEAAINGCDFVGTYGSLAAASRTVEFDLNALNALLFPRLSPMASVWKRYVFDRLVFHLFGVAAATQEGFVAMASIVTDDLATESTVGGEVDVLNMEGAAIGRPWGAVSHRVRCEAEGLKWYTSDNLASTSSYGEAMGRAFLYLPQTVAGDGKISIQVYVEYSVQFSQRVPYQIEPPVSTVLTAETLEEFHRVKTDEFSFNVADHEVATVLEESLITQFGEIAENYGRAFVGSISSVEQTTWNKILDKTWASTEVDIISLFEKLGTWFGLYEFDTSGINELAKLTPFFYQMILGRATNFPSTSMRDWLEKLVFPVIDAAVAQGLSSSVFQLDWKNAIDGWTPGPERLDYLASLDLEGQVSPSLTRDLAKHKELRTAQSLDNDSEDVRRECLHPDIIEGVKICCTSCM